MGRYDLRLLGTFTEVSVTGTATRKQRETLQQVVSKSAKGSARGLRPQLKPRGNLWNWRRWAQSSAP